MMQIKCSFKYFCFGSVLIFVGSILLCALGITVVLPYEATKNWPQVICTVVSAGYNGDHCSCTEHVYENENCLLSYPCLQIYVTYDMNSTNHILPDIPEENHTTKRLISHQDLTQADPDYFHRYISGEEKARHRIRHAKMKSLQVDKKEEPIQSSVKNSSNHAMLYRAWSDAFYNACSIHECGVEEWNVKEGYRFYDKWGQIGSRFPCYININQPSAAILEKEPYSYMMHAILWPTLCLTIGFLIWLGLWCGCWTIEMEHPEKYPQKNYGLGMVS